MRRTHSMVASVVMVALLGASLAACSSPSPTPSPTTGSMPQHCTKTGPVVFVVSGRQNSPSPALTSEMFAAARTAIPNGSSIGLVDLDGEPRLTEAARSATPVRMPSPCRKHSEGTWTRSNPPSSKLGQLTRTLTCSAPST